MRFPHSLVFAVALAGMLPSSRAEAAVDFAKEIQPIFAAHCYGCHGEEKGLGKLRLHSSDAITASQEKHDDLIASGEPDKSELYARLVLPADHKKRMPKKADPLGEKEIALIKQWIEEGATFATTAPAPKTEAPPEPKQRPPLDAATPEAIAAAEQLGALVSPIFAGAAELRVSFPSSPSEVTDETVAALAPLAGQIVELDLSGSAITDAAAGSLAKFQNTDVLHLENTAIGDTTVGTIATMPYLRYLNLHSTKATDASLESLKSATSLRKLYLWQTTASFDAAMALEKATPGLEVNLGWNHPGVVRLRVTKQLKQLEAKKTERDASVAEAEKSLAAAKAEQTAAVARDAELKKQLAELDKPAEEKPAEEKPVEEKPVEEKPAEEKPAEEKPAEEKPGEESAADVEGNSE